MGLLDIIRGWVYRRVLEKSASHKTFDIIEIRTKELSLTYVSLETDIRIENNFFLPITILSIETNIVNRDGIKVGTMRYHEPKRLKGRSAAVFTTRSKMSNITAFFHALSHLLSISVTMRSVGTARIKFLWWVFEIPVDDTFEVKPGQVKLTEDVSAEEKQKRAEERKQQQQEREQRRAERMKDRTKSQEPRVKTEETVKSEETITPEPEIMEENTMEVELDEKAINSIELEITNNSMENSAIKENTVADPEDKEVK